MPPALRLAKVGRAPVSGAAGAHDAVRLLRDSRLHRDLRRPRSVSVLRPLYADGPWLSRLLRGQNLRDAIAHPPLSGCGGRQADLRAEAGSHQTDAGGEQRHQQDRVHLRHARIDGKAANAPVRAAPCSPPSQSTCGIPARARGPEEIKVARKKRIPTVSSPNDAVRTFRRTGQSAISVARYHRCPATGPWGRGSGRQAG